MALSSTFHWMFDRGLISIDDDYGLLLKRDAIPGSVLSLVNSDGRLRVPDERIYHPPPPVSGVSPRACVQGVMGTRGPTLPSKLSMGSVGRCWTGARKWLDGTDSPDARTPGRQAARRGSFWNTAGVRRVWSRAGLGDRWTG